MTRATNGTHHKILNLLIVEKSNSTNKSLGTVQKLSNFLTLSPWLPVIINEQLKGAVKQQRPQAKLMHSSNQSYSLQSTQSPEHIKHLRPTSIITSVIRWHIGIHSSRWNTWCWWCSRRLMVLIWVPGCWWHAIMPTVRITTRRHSDRTLWQPIKRWSTPSSAQSTSRTTQTPTYTSHTAINWGTRPAVPTTIWSGTISAGAS